MGQCRNDNGNIVEKWVTRDKIRRFEKSAVYQNIYRPDVKTDNEEELARVTVFDDVVPAPDNDNRDNDINIENPPADLINTRR